MKLFLALPCSDLLNIILNLGLIIWSMGAFLFFGVLSVVQVIFYLR